MYRRSSGSWAPITTAIRASRTSSTIRAGLSTWHLLVVFGYKLGDKRLDDSDRAVERKPHRFGEVGDQLVVVQVQAGRRLTAHDERARGLAAEGLDEREHVHGIHAMPIDRRRVGIVDVRLDDVDRAGRLAPRRRVQQQDRLVVGHRVGEVHTADAEVDDVDAGWQLALGKPSRQGDAEAVVAEEDVADASDQNAARDVPRLEG